MDRAGSLDRLKLLEEEYPEPGIGQVRVRVNAVGLNFADIFAILGLYSATPRGAFIPGLEFAGVVEAVGPGTAGPGPGTRVMGVTRFGAYASFLNIDARYLQPLPEAWSFTEGAAYLAQGLTAYYALRPLGDCNEGDTVLVHSAAGGVGLIAIELVKRFGGQVIATVGDDSKIDFLNNRAGLRSEQIIVRDARRFGEGLDRALGVLGARGLDLILDSVAGEYFAPAYDRLNPAGRHVLFGSAGFMPRGSRPNWLRLALQYLRRPRLDPLKMISDNKSLLAFNLIWLWERVDEFHAMFREMHALRLPPPYVGHRFAFADARAALDLFKSGKTVGKVVLTMDAASGPE